MSTTIAPATGAGVLFTQQGVGTTPGYSAIDLRRSEVPGPIQEGVYANGDYMVTQRGVGANLSVDIATGFGCVQGDSVTNQGLYTIPPHSAVINEVIATADVTNPRIDQVILEVLDNVHDSSGANLARTRVLTGTPTGGATLTNRTGAAALPSNACRLADILVGAAAASVTNSVIRDRRPWARGATARIALTAGNYTTTTTALASATSMGEIDATNLKPRIECSGAPLRMVLRGAMNHSVSAARYFVAPAVDGTLVDSSNADAFQHDQNANAASFTYHEIAWVTVPSAGSHQLSFQFAVLTAGTLTIGATAARPLLLLIEELVKQNTANNTTTSG